MISEEDLHDYERMGCSGDSLLHRAVCALVSEVRRLAHELNDPNYQYSGRIHRQAIICRNTEIDSLRKELAELKKAKSP